MFQDNPLLNQLKQQLHAQTLRVEGTVKGTDKNFGFLETDGQKTYFIPPPQMKKVMHGDRVIAAIHPDKDREIAEPESLVEPFLTRFVGRIRKKDNRLFIKPDHPNIKDSILSRPVKGLSHSFEEGDWVIAEMRKHPLKDNAFFNAEITEFITTGQDHFAPWWVTLARNQLEKQAPSGEQLTIIDENLSRSDLTALNFFTIDSATTEDMDDAVYLEEQNDGGLKLYVAIADPTAYIAENSELDQIARKRAFTNYLPGFDIPMLPRELANDLCSLCPNERRPALVCSVSVNPDGSLGDDIQFSCSWITSKAKLAYNQVSDWLENTGDWRPNNTAIEEQLKRLQRFSELRIEWRRQHTLVFKERPDYRFILDDCGNVIDIKTEQRRIANRMIEEAMIAANMCAAKVLKERVGFGIFNIHSGFDNTKIDQLINILKDNDLVFERDDLLTLSGFRTLRRRLDEQPTAYLDMRTRRYQSYAEMALESAPHFGLGVENYATWTSPIRKYGDMVNHRLLKALIIGAEPQKPDLSITTQLSERKRLNRQAEREIGDWLYCRYLQDKADSTQRFDAEITDVTRGGIRARLSANGAIVFIPATFIHAVRDELVCQHEQGAVQIKGEVIYRQGDRITVVLTEVRAETRHIIARIV